MNLEKSYPILVPFPCASDSPRTTRGCSLTTFVCWESAPINQLDCVFLVSQDIMQTLSGRRCVPPVLLADLCLYREVSTQLLAKTAKQVSMLDQARHPAHSALLVVRTKTMTQQLSALNVLPERMLAVAKHGAANVYRVRSTVTAAPQHRAPRVYRASTGRAQWVDHPALVSSAQRVKPTQMKTALLLASTARSAHTQLSARPCVHLA